MSKQGRSCCCNWNDCETFRQIIVNDCEGCHVWKGPIIRIQFSERNPCKMTEKKFALFKSINRHVLSDEYHTEIPSNVYILPHHFPKAFLQWRNDIPKAKDFSTPLTMQEAKEISVLDQRNRYIEYTNSMFNLHNSLLKKLPYERPPIQNTKCKHLFIQSPFTLFDEVQSFIGSLTSTQKKVTATLNLEIGVTTVSDVTTAISPLPNSQISTNIPMDQPAPRSDSPMIVPSVDLLN